jgi:hypothetical protein
LPPSPKSPPLRRSSPPRPPRRRKQVIKGRCPTPRQRKRAIELTGQECGPKPTRFRRTTEDYSRTAMSSQEGGQKRKAEEAMKPCFELRPSAAPALAEAGAEAVAAAALLDLASSFIVAASANSAASAAASADVDVLADATTAGPVPTEVGLQQRRHRRSMRRIL